MSLANLFLQRRRAWVVALVALLLGIAGIVLVGEAESSPTATQNLAAGTDSTKVVELQARLPQGDDSTAVVVWSADAGTLSESAVATIDAEYTAQLQAVAEESPAAGGPPTAAGPPAAAGPPGAEQPGPPGAVVAEDGTAAIGVVPVAAQGDEANAEAVTALRAELREAAPDGVTVQVTGPAAVRADLGAVFEGADTRLLLATAGIVALLLLITYRSPILWVIPLVTVAIADRLAVVTATQALSALDMKWDGSTTGILSVLVFGAGTDYALLLISRYRNELRRTQDRYAAMRQALRHSGEAILASSTTVVLGVLTLLLSLVPTTRSLGLASAVGVLVAMVFALVVLPAVLVLFGRWVFWPLVPRVGQTQLVDSDRSLWRRVGNAVARRPFVFVVGTVTLLVVMAGGLTQVTTGLSESDQFLQKPEAIAAAERLAESFPAGTSDPAVVITPEAEASRVVDAAAAVPGVASAAPSRSGDGLTQVDVVLEAGSGTDEAKEAVRDLRAALDGIPDTYVGGSEAEGIDTADAAARDRLVIFPVILGLVLVALFVLLRSVVAPLVLVTTVVMTYLAALGASHWIFTGLFGFDALGDAVPLFSFLFLVALGVDYNIFLVTRAQEESEGHGPRYGMLRALAATGGVITSAGILLAAVFAVLGVLPLVVLAQIGTVICLGVLLDTLVVRTVLVPSIAVLLGERFWWPRKVGDPELDRIEVDHEQPLAPTSTA
ncbi:MAG TPA: MMPL family transporter [Dermatophilaceae bacterium]|nr:MMPL family transporter [Dermatophilaceae bacterium]